VFIAILSNSYDGAFEFVGPFQTHNEAAIACNARQHNDPEDAQFYRDNNYSWQVRELTPHN
jgi:hypothetical protein